MPDTAYAFALDQYIQRITPVADPDEAYQHRVGDIVQLQVSRPPVEIMSRHCGGLGAVYVARSVTDGLVSAVKSPRLDGKSDHCCATPAASCDGCAPGLQARLVRVATMPRAVMASPPAASSTK